MTTPLTISQINGVDLSTYATKAAGFKRCVAQLQSAASDLQSKVVHPLSQDITWNNAISTDGQRVAHVHASTLHHAIDGTELVYVTLNHLGPDLDEARKNLQGLIQSFQEDYQWTVADDGTVTVGPPTGLTKTQIAVQQYEGTYPADVMETPFAGNPALPTTLVLRAIAAFQQIDENAATVINTVVNAASTIVVDTTNVALHANVDASPKGFDNLLALYGDPLKDVVENAEADPEEYESAAIRGELANGLRELSSSEIKTLSAIFKKSPYPQLRDLGDFMDKNPGSEAIQEYLENGGAKTFVAVSVLLNYLKYKDSAPSGVAVLEGAATTAISAGTGAVTGLTAGTMTDFALGGPENPLADVAAVGVGLVTSWFVSNSVSNGFDELNKELFDKGSDGQQSDAPDPLKLGSSPIDGAAGS